MTGQSAESLRKRQSHLSRLITGLEKELALWSGPYDLKDKEVLSKAKQVLTKVRNNAERSKERAAREEKAKTKRRDQLTLQASKLLRKRAQEMSRGEMLWVLANSESSCWPYGQLSEYLDYLNRWGIDQLQARIRDGLKEWAHEKGRDLSYAIVSDLWSDVVALDAELIEATIAKGLKGYQGREGEVAKIIEEIDRAKAISEAENISPIRPR